ncbi:MAG: 30S ribosomal protein S20 [Lentisphaerae bacterium]|jgi:small subunit ribosomal protein S20|nr:30S ribosomal protein S20 [Lentisphaerota bacterium]
MPNIKSAAKRLRQNEKNRMFNRMRKSRVRTAENALDELIKAGDKEAVAAGLTRCYSELDKAAKNGVIHKNKADRKKQRLAARVAKMA